MDLTAVNGFQIRLSGRGKVTQHQNILLKISTILYSTRNMQIMLAPMRALRLVLEEIVTRKRRVFVGDFVCPIACLRMFAPRCVIKGVIRMGNARMGD